MIKGTRSAIYMGAGLLGALSLTISSAFAGELGPDTEPGAQKLKGAQLQCSGPEYNYNPPPSPAQAGQPDPAKISACQSCQNTVKSQQASVEKARAAALQKNAAVVGSGTTASGVLGSTANGQQENAMGNTSGVNNVGNNAQAQRAAIANALASQAQNCGTQIKNSCNVFLSSSDKQAVQDASGGCSDIAGKSTANATEKAASSSSMGDMSQLASALGSALGPLAAMMGQQPTAETPMTPYDSGLSDSFDTASTEVSTPAGTDGSKLADLGTNGMNIGKNDTGGTSLKNPLSTGITGGAPSASMYNPYASDSEKSGTEFATAANGASSNGGGEGASMAGAGGLGSGSGSGKEATEAEKAALAAAAAEAGMGEEYGVGGAGGRPSFIGLKGGAKAEEEFTGEGESVLGDLGLEGEEGGRGLASADELQGVGEEDGHTLFHVVHSKIAEIKKRGSI